MVNEAMTPEDGFQIGRISRGFFDNSDLDTSRFRHASSVQVDVQNGVEHRHQAGRAEAPALAAPEMPDCDAVPLACR